MNDAPRTPAALRDTYADWEWEVTWQLSPDTITYLLTHPDGRTRHLKLTSAGWFPSLAAEAARMRWAGPYLPVPEVFETGSEGAVDWLITASLRGLRGTHPELCREPARLVETLALGLRQFHEAPAAHCPFDFSVDVSLRWVRNRLERGRIDPERDYHSEHAGLTAEQALRQLERNRPMSEDRVVCHGDYCLPNVLIEDGVATGFVDLGELGIADRWWDLAVATWSVTWNLGPGYEDAFLAAYGAEPDAERIAWYRLLYDNVS